MFKFNKIILSVILATTLAQAESKEAKDIEVYAKEVQQSNGDVLINNGVVVEYEGSIFQADKAKYKPDENNLILNDNVILIDKSGKRIRAEELTLNLDNNHIVFKDFFTLGKDNIWLSSTNGKKEENIITTKNAMFSSCDVENPDWMLGFNKAVYDTKTEEIRFYDAKVYVKKVPVFYFPYLYIPLSKERRSGFLYPQFSILSNEGYMYRQPYFLNISKSQDLEIAPQIMTKRGYGVVATYRFYHAKDAFGTIRAGYFKDKASYAEKEDLLHDYHYGVEANYINNSLVDQLSKNGYENKLYLNSVYFNDGDYFNLQSGPLSHHTVGSYYDSRLNYYVKSDSLYSGVNFHYYKSTTTSNNDNTLQILPQLQFHLPFSNLISDNIYYSFDAVISNITRKKGTKAVTAAIKAPLYAHFSLLNNYLNLNITEELQLNAYKFINTTSKEKKYARVSANHKIELSTDLTNVYESGVHSLRLSAIYTKSNNISEKWMEYSDIPVDLKQDFVDDLAYESKVALRMHQKWKPIKGKLTIEHILEANYYTKDKEFKNLDNSLSLKYDKWSFNTFVGYSLNKHKISRIYSTLGYGNGKVGFNIGYLWNKDYDSLATLSKQLTLRSYYKYSDRLAFSAGANYDLVSKNLSKWNISTDLNRKCWAVNFSFGQDIRSVVKASGNSSIKNNYFSFTFTILPFGISYGR
jgi:LPS-assembly protein